MTSPLQRRAIWELAITTSAGLLVAGAWPWLGIRAMGFFGFLGLLPFGELFVYWPGLRVERDERDRSYEVRAYVAGSSAMAYVFLMGLISMTFASEGQETVPAWWLIVLIWSSFAILYWVRSAVMLWCLRKDTADAAST